MKRPWYFLFGFLLMLSLGGLLHYASASQGNLMTLKVYLNSHGDNVNAFEGTLHFPSSWSIENINLKHSKTIYWIETPEASFGDGSIDFSGIIPGGINNLSSPEDPYQLYSIDFYGYDAARADLSFSDTLFYLNHPAALTADHSNFSTSIEPNNSYTTLETGDDLLGLRFSFTQDPVTHAPVLLLNSSQGNLASYSFEEKEGDFNFSDWLPVDGVQTLDSNASTVLLSSVSNAGDTQELLLRSSFLHEFFWWIGTFFFVLLTVYLLVAAYRIFRFK